MSSSIQRLLDDNIIEPEFMKKLKFVIVDDNDFALRVLSEILFSLGARTIREFSDPREALGYMWRNNVDVLIVDKMGGRDLEGVAYVLLGSGKFGETISEVNLLRTDVPRVALRG